MGAVLGDDVIEAMHGKGVQCQNEAAFREQWW